MYIIETIQSVIVAEVDDLSHSIPDLLVDDLAAMVAMHAAPQLTR